MTQIKQHPYSRIMLRLAAVVLALGGLLFFTAKSSAEEAGKELSQQVIESTVDFQSLGFEGDRVLAGPFDATQYFFSLPANWNATGQPTLKLDFDVFSIYVGDSVRTGTVSDSFLAGTLEITLNNILLDQIQLEKVGPRSVTLPIPNEALAAVSEEGRFSLQITLRSGEDCTLEQDTKVTIKPTSQFVFPHTFKQPEADLTLLPRPIFQRSFLPDQALIVLPSSPTAAELQAALITAAGFGSMTNGRLITSLATADAIPTELLSTHHIIFVGQRDRYAGLDEATLPVPMNEDGFLAAGANPGDGLVQMTVSPWNTNGVVLVITGADDAAVVKAAKAVSTGNIQVSRRRSLAVVANVEPRVSLNEIRAVDHTLSSLGYGTRTLSGLGEVSAEYEFYIQPGQEADGELFFDLAYINSALLNFEQSALAVRLNGDLIGGLRLTEDSTTLMHELIVIPASAIKPGTNELVFEATLVPFAKCTAADQSNQIWLTLRPESLLHIPLKPAEINLTKDINLQDYPQPFLVDPALRDIAFVVPTNDLTAWQAAAQIAQNLGDVANLEMADLAVTFGDEVSEDLRLTHNLIVVGRATALPFMAEINDKLPIQFAPGSDDIVENQLPVTYRLPTNAGLGYLQLTPAPWDRRRLVMTVAGRTDDGVQEATTALLDPGLRRQMRGDFAAVSGTQLTTFDTDASIGLLQELTVDTPLETETAIPVLENAETADPNAWISSVLTASFTLIGLIGAGVIGLAAYRIMQRRQAAEAQQKD